MGWGELVLGFIRGLYNILWDEKSKDWKLTVYESHEAIEDWCGVGSGCSFSFVFFFLGNTDLDAVVAGGDLAVLDLHIGGGMGELALGVLARAFVALKFATDLQLQPARVLAVQQAVHIDNVGHRVYIGVI